MTLETISIAQLQLALADHPTGETAIELAQQIRSRFGGEQLSIGASPWADELTVAWAIESPTAKSSPKIVSTDSKFVLPLQPIGSTGIFLGVASLPERAGFTWRYEVNGEPFNSGPIEVYITPEENKPQPDVPQGEWQDLGVWESEIFPGTTRQLSIYIPAQYRPEEPACVLIFQDGETMKTWNMTTALDNLIAKGDIPVVVGISIDAGTLQSGKSNRGFEYDTLSDQYARFLLEEILPEVEKTVNLRHDAAGRALIGHSSGGICAWTVAWERPDQFRNVISWNGSFANMVGDEDDTFAFPNYRMGHGENELSGGHNYPFLIRRRDRKPIRIFLQGNENDLDLVFGNWAACNLQMAKALAFKEYDYRFEFGNGFHTPWLGMSVWPETLRWIWRDERN